MPLAAHRFELIDSGRGFLSKLNRPRYTILLILSVFCIFTLEDCRAKAGIDKVMENGVEVILNHLAPCPSPGRPSTLTLQEFAAIDTENDATARAGVTDFYLFDVDSQGNIYVMVPPTHPGPIVFKLSPEGKPLLSFAPTGQGPFELEYPSGIHVDGTDRVWLLESPKKKYHVFDAQGNRLFETVPELHFEEMAPLDGGNFLIMQMKRGDPQSKYWSLTIGIADAEMHFRNELDNFGHYPNKMLMDSIPDKFVCGTDYVFLAKAAAGKIFAGNSDRGYEILVYDLAGRLQRKIRKDYVPVPVSQEFRKKTTTTWEQMNSAYAARVYFPDNWHPFQSFLADDRGHLMVMTYEQGKSPGEYMFDVFDQDGVFVARTSLNVARQGYGQILARIRGDRLYAVQDKPSGFKRLAVYRMIWR